MKKWKVKKILIILSIIIIFIGIILGLSVSNELINTLPSEKIHVDSTGFSKLVQIGGFIGSKILGLVIIFYSIFIDILIWLIYGFVLIIMKIIKKINDRKKVV